MALYFYHRKGFKEMKIVLDWESYFMAIARITAMRSKDPNTRNGAIVVNKDNQIIGVGYNGMIRGSNPNDFPWERKGDYLDTKYPYVVHAEANAIMNVSDPKELRGATLYTTLFPCAELCGKMICQLGIKRVVYLSDKYAAMSSFIASKRLFTSIGIVFELYKCTLTDPTVSFRLDEIEESEDVSPSYLDQK